MSTVLDAITSFVNRLGTGQFPIPPKPDTLDGHIPDMSALARDGQGIICQRQADGSLDGGDSAHRTGVAAFCNSAFDGSLLPLFESTGVMTRHPTQAPWNNWKNCTRDQLTGYVAGCWRANCSAINRRLYQAHKNRVPPFTCQNTENDAPGTTKIPPIGDLLSPADIMFLRIAAGDDAAFRDVLAQFSLHVAIEVADRDVKIDKTNLMLESIVCGRLNLFVQVHSNYEDCLRYYWSGWRQQPRIAEELIWVVQKELSRYPASAVPRLPENELNRLKGLDLAEELKKLDPVHRVRFQDAWKHIE